MLPGAEINFGLFLYCFQPKLHCISFDIFVVLTVHEVANVFKSAGVEGQTVRQEASFVGNK